MAAQCVLVVEDHPLIRRALAALLESMGYVVTTAGSVAEGLRALDGQECALLDVMLPDGGGAQVLGEIRRRGLPMRVALMSAADGAAESVAAATGPRAERFFEKPLDVEAVLEWIGPAITIPQAIVPPVQ